MRKRKNKILKKRILFFHFRTPPSSSGVQTALIKIGIFYTEADCPENAKKKK